MLLLLSWQNDPWKHRDFPRILPGFALSASVQTYKCLDEPETVSLRRLAASCFRPGPSRVCYLYPNGLPK
jgi:hypothetical protein